MLTELDPRLTELVEFFWKAPPRERAAVLARMRRQRPGPPPLAEPTESPTGPSRPHSPPPDLEGPFVRLLQGGRLLLPSGEHFITEAQVTSARLQHGEIVRATPMLTPNSGAPCYTYSVRQPGPLVTPSAAVELGYPVPAEDGLVLVHTTGGNQVLVARHDLQTLGASDDQVLTVAYLPDARYQDRYLGRVIKIHPTAPQDLSPSRGPDRNRRQRPATACGTSRVPLARFQPIGERRPVITLVGGHPQSRARWAGMLAEYGAVLRPLPYSPKIRQIRTAVEASDLVIAFPSCCRTGHWEAALNTARTARRLFFYGESENESGLRHQLETEVIVEWNSMAGR